MAMQLSRFPEASTSTLYRPLFRNSSSHLIHHNQIFTAAYGYHFQTSRTEKSTGMALLLNSSTTTLLARKRRSSDSG
ncbi:hypothetical protein F2Q69_00035751 [Brassica cretica]|uniref:Uncharacterized protein n=1 Tax=Brassica cretica TaxID=69181 RepID=A0A8S9SJR6_BRACR|nr:hypothetical protein F2Q69_00035751 [Brassica cretica]